MIDLREMRVNRGLSLRAAAREMEINNQVLLRAEAGARPHPRHALKIANFYGFKVTDIWPLPESEAA